jgi:hypothetical protein
VIRALVAGLVLAACGGPPPVSLDPAWPESAGDYQDVTEAWTRREVRRETAFHVIVDAQATFKSPAWRAAYVGRQARVLELAPDARAALLAEQKAEAAAAHEFVLSLTAFDDTGRLLHQKDSPWRVTLVDGNGRVFTPTSIKRERGNEEARQALFPHIGEFDDAYVVQFPAEATVLGTEGFILRLASARGSVDLTWRDRS